MAYEKIIYSCEPVEIDGVLVSCGSNGLDTVKTVIKIREYNNVYEELSN